MRDYTDRHHRRLTRLLTRESTLWSEMEKARAILRAADTSDRKLSRLLLRGSPGGREVLQLGGDDPELVGAAAALALDFDYDEINLNCGCPAVETGGGDFGASLMRDPSRAAAVIAALHRVADPRGVPISVKCRVGVAETIDDVVPADASPEEIEAALAAPLRAFVLACVDAGARSVVVHCREAVMAGLSPRANRDAPPLRPELAARLARDLRGGGGGGGAVQGDESSLVVPVPVPVPVPVTLNGGISSIAEAVDAVTRAPELAGVQVGRWALRRPLDMLAVDSGFYGGDGRADGRLGLEDVAAAVDAVESYVYRYAMRELETGEATLGALARPLALVLADADERADAGDADDEEAAAAEAVASAALSCFGALAEGGRGAGAEGDERTLRKTLAKAVGKKAAGKQRGTRAEAAAAANRPADANERVARRV
jgi:tRNA-dihydrouridine synthase A